jgi:fatty-acyl-CoA synthase
MPATTGRPDWPDIMGWLREPRDDHGIRLSSQDGWRFHSYRSLSQRANGTAHQIMAAGIKPGSRVGVVVTDPVRFSASFFGVLASGATAVPVAPPTTVGVDYTEYAAKLLTAADVNAVMTPDEMRPSVVAALAHAELDVPVLGLDAPPADEPPPVRPAPLALIQFTSGSTGKPRGAMISPAALGAQVGMLSDWLDWGPADSAASWLPLYHDMGLVGAFLLPLYQQSDLRQMSPSEFIRDPLSFLRCISENHVTMIAGPTFGYAHMARRVSPDKLAGTDFSALRAAVASAERLDPQALASFARLLADRGFRFESLRTAYGLAEATLAVSAGCAPRVLSVDWSDIRIGSQVKVTDTRPLGEAHAVSGAGLVSSGPALPGTKVWVTDDENVPLPDGWLGEITVSSPSMALGYVGDADNGGSTRFADGYLRTGDAGFILDDEVYVVGRIADVIKVRGQAVYAEQIEDRLAEALAIPSLRVAVVPGHEADGDSVVVIIAGLSAGPALTTIVAILAGVCGGARVKIYAVSRRNGIPMTTSGKKRRRLLGESVLAGTFAGQLRYDSADRQGPAMVPPAPQPARLGEGQ